MRRTITLLAAVTLVVGAVNAPAVAIPKNYPTWETWCNIDGEPTTGTGFAVTPVGSVALNGREPIPDQVGVGVPGWTQGVHAPSIFFGGTVYRYVQGEGGEWVPDPAVFGLTFEPPPGKDGKVTYCLTWAYIGPFVVVWDPVWLFFSPPATPRAS